MTKKIILGIIVFFVIMGGVSFWIFNSIDQTAAENKSRSETDFTTEHFTVKELWEMAQKENDRVLISYLFIKVNEAPINLRLPWEGSKASQDSLARKIKPGGQIEVKVLKNQLASARQEGAVKAIGRFIMGDKREVTLYKLTIANEVLVDRDIHDYDEARVTLLNRMISNPWLILIPFAILIYIITYVKKRNQKKATT